MGTAPLDLSVVIVSWNTCDVTCQCLRSVYEHSRSVDLEVIVVDNGSIDDSVAVFETEFPQVTLITNESNLGFAAANNQGIESARGRYVLLLNSDMIVIENSLEKVLYFADRHPEAAVVGCRLLNKDRTLQPSCFMFPSVLNLFLSTTFLAKLFPRSGFFGRESMGWWDRETSMEVDVVTGCFMLVRREAFMQVGLMDKRYFMFGEETDWCYRFVRAGWQNLFCAETSIIHLGGQSTKRVRDAMVLQLRSGILQFISIHRSVVEYCLACLLVSFWFAVRVPPWMFLATTRSSGKKDCFSRALTYVKGMVRALFGYRALAVRGK